MALAFAETVTILRPAGRDARTGDESGSPVEVVVGGCAAWPATSAEDTFRGDTITVGYTLLLPPGTDILPTDRVQLYGQVWNVDGEPARWRSQLTGTEPGIQVSLRRGTG